MERINSFLPDVAVDEPSNVTKQKIRERLTDERVAAVREAASDGHLTPTALLDIARSPDSPLHDLFEWDDSVAAERWRLDQAREIIRSVRVEITTVDHGAVSVPAFVRDVSLPPETSGYRSIQAIRKDSAASNGSLIYEIRHALGYVTRAAKMADALNPDVGKRVETARRNLLSALRHLGA